MRDRSLIPEDKLNLELLYFFLSIIIFGKILHLCSAISASHFLVRFGFKAMLKSKQVRTYSFSPPFGRVCVV